MSDQGYQPEKYGKSSQSGDELSQRLEELSDVDLTPVRGPSAASSDWSSSSSLHATVSRQPGNSCLTHSSKLYSKLAVPYLTL